MNVTGKLAVGMKRAAETESNAANSASAVGSGLLDVFATPAMAALMEKAAAELTQEHLADGWTSVGTRLDIEHVSATPIGMKVRAEAEVTGVDGRKLTFSVRAFDEAGEIGRGIHERVAVESAKFMARAAAKK